MKIKHILLAMTVVFPSCHDATDEKQDDRTPHERPQENIKKQLLELQGQLQSLATSDWASCNGGSLSAAAKSICGIAKAATEETRVEMRGAIKDLASQLDSQITDTHEFLLWILNLSKRGLFRHQSCPRSGWFYQLPLRDQRPYQAIGRPVHQ